MDDMTSRNHFITPGDVRRLGGRIWRVEALLGQGSEGKVWRVRAENGDAQAWKRFRPTAADGLRRDHLRWLIDQPPPSPHLLWPTVITAGPVGLGYLMPLRPAGSAPLARLIRGVVSIDDGLALRCAAELAGAVASVHAAGLVFRDVSVGNVFFDARTGAIALCDVDNTARDGRSVPRVRGTPGFIAPEVATGRVRAGRGSDLYALAVLITCVLTRSMPIPPYQLQLDNAWPPHLVGLAERVAGPGFRNPAMRPEAVEWKLALEAAQAFWSLSNGE